MNGEGANPCNCKAWQKATMQAKSKSLNSCNVIRHRISTQFSKQREACGKLEKGYGYNARKAYPKAKGFSGRFFKIFNWKY